MSLSCDEPSLYTPWVAIDVSPIAILALVMRHDAAVKKVWPQ